MLADPRSPRTQQSTLKKSLALSPPEVYNRFCFQEVDVLEAEAQWWSVSSGFVGWLLASIEQLGRTIGDCQ
jgi:hypothetical protein